MSVRHLYRKSDAVYLLLDNIKIKQKTTMLIFNIVTGDEGKEKLFKY